MKRNWLLWFVIAGSGGSILFHLVKREKELIAELSEPQEKEGRTRENPGIRKYHRISDLPVEVGSLRGRILLDRVKQLNHLSTVELKFLVEEIFQWESNVFPDEKSSLIYGPVMELICARAPEWFLKRTEDDWKAGKEKVRWRGWDERAFEAFLEIDPQGALKWYEDGRFDRPISIYEKYELRIMAIEESLKRDPERGIRLMQNRLFPKDAGFSWFPPGMGRFDRKAQVDRCLEAVLKTNNLEVGKILSPLILRETYRLGGQGAIRDLMEANLELFGASGKLGKYGVLQQLGPEVYSKEGIEDLHELIKGAGEEVQVAVISHALSGWAWRDLAAAEEAILNLRPGPVRQESLRRLVRSKAEHDPDGASSLLSGIHNAGMRAELIEFLEVFSKQQ